MGVTQKRGVEHVDLAPVPGTLDEEPHYVSSFTWCPLSRGCTGRITRVCRTVSRG